VTRFHKGVTLVAGLVLLASLAVWWHARRELTEVRRELQAVTEANLFLKKTLGDMTIAITGKDKEIDRLEHAPCNGQEKVQPGSKRTAQSHRSSRRQTHLCETWD
jgi:hypothetical protein